MENVHVASFGPMTRAGRYQLDSKKGDEESSLGVVLKLLVQTLVMNR